MEKADNMQQLMNSIEMVTLRKNQKEMSAIKTKRKNAFGRCISRADLTKEKNRENEDRQ